MTSDRTRGEHAEEPAEGSREQGEEAEARVRRSEEQNGEPDQAGEPAPDQR